MKEIKTVMPKNYTTDWMKVATAGPTADGRELKPEWFTDMAETYDTSEYTARIWLDHWRLSGPMGEVVELKTENDRKDRLCLFAKIRPNAELIERNKKDWNLFTSIEVTEDFAKSGKAYLTGLAVTDEPASLGTQKLEFTKRGIDSGVLVFNTQCRIERNDMQQSESETTLFNKLKTLLGSNQENTNHNTEKSMDNEQFKLLTEKLDSMTSEFSAVAKNMTKEKQDKEVNAKEDTEENTEKKNGDSKEFSALIEKLDALSVKVEAMDKRFSKEKSGTEVEEHNGTDDDSEELY